MKVAAYQVPLLPLGSMAAVSLIKQQLVIPPNREVQVAQQAEPQQPADESGS
jgi:hypothetical protein